MPALIVLILILCVRSIFLPGASEGLAFLFSVDWGNLANPAIWVEALIQNAWDTRSRLGFGFMLCGLYAGQGRYNSKCSPFTNRQ